MPKLSPTMTAGQIGAWRKKPGDEVAAGDVIADIETDKASIEFEATEDFVLAKILVEEGVPDVAVGAPIAVSVEDAKDVSAFESFSASDAGSGDAGSGDADGKAAAPPAEKPAASAPDDKKDEAPEREAETAKAAAPPVQHASAPAPTEAAEVPNSLAARVERVAASPLAKRLAAEQGVSLQTLAGSYPGGFVVAADLAKAAPAEKGGAEATSKAAPALSEAELASSAASYAEQVANAKRTIPHYYLSVDVDVGAALAQLVESSSEREPIELEDVILKAAALASTKVTAVNSSWLGDRIRRYESVDVNILAHAAGAVMQPLLRDVSGRGLVAIGKLRRAALEAAAQGALDGGAQAAGTLSVMFAEGVSEAAAVIRPPQSAVLSVGALRSVPQLAPGERIAADGTAPLSALRLARVFTATLSCDHRVVDGAVGAQWLAAFKSHIEDPLSMLR
mmetsp:Transcript_13030/g.35070  ORF Transcript_13030/g.35070 Transcript_13030/m.35070 type:complete len:451 (-) Transcript_13030:333-1685(-)